MATASQTEALPERRSRKRIYLFLLLALLLVAFVPPFITFNHFRRGLESSMSAAVGRKVTVQNVYMRLLPQPGFELDNFAIEDDPSFSEEPLLRADSVVADLRLTSLWRGRVEVSRLDLTDPSLNLVRGADGRWNIEEVLAHASQVPAAPTGRSEMSERPRFPYIEATGGRINFKIGSEKKVFAFSDADFAIWLASEDQWQMRLSARPVRTDADLSDTGTLRVNASFSRSPEVRTSPLKLSLELTNSQLGELSQLVYGRDRGWRGTVNATAQVSGSPTALNFAGKVSLLDFHRYDIATSTAFAAEASCDGIAWSEPASGEMLRGTCTLPSGHGSLAVTGEYSVVSHNGSATLLAANFPSNAALEWLRRMKQGIAPDLEATGAINGRVFLYRGDTAIDPAHIVQGRTSSTLTASFALSSATLRPPVDLGVLVFDIEQPLPAGALDSLHLSRRQRAAALAPATLALLPTRLSLGGTTPLDIAGSASRAGYGLVLQGGAETARLQSLLASLGLQDAQLSLVVPGQARVDLNYSGAWSGFPAPSLVSSIHLLNPALAATAERPKR